MSDIILKFEEKPINLHLSQGLPGKDGADGQDGTDGISPTVTVGETETLPAGSFATVENVGTETDVVLNFGIPKGDKGDSGEAIGGLPTGGVTGQILKKSSAVDYDAEWDDAESGLPQGGTTGQVLTKSTDDDYDVAWADSQGSSVPTGGTIGQVLAKNSNADGDAGWYNVWHLPTDKWWLPDGVLESNVIAAWRFKGALSEASALQDLTGHGYELTVADANTYWDVNGFHIDATNGAGLNNALLLSDLSELKCVAFGYSFIPTTGKKCGGFGTGTYGIHLQGTYADGSGSHARNKLYARSINPTARWSTSGLPPAVGVIGMNYNSKILYINGTVEAISHDGNQVTTSSVLLGQDNINSVANLAFDLKAAVLYSAELTTLQHAELVTNINSL